MDNDTDAILINEYLITIKQDIKTHQFYHLFNRLLEKYGFEIKLDDDFIYIKKKNEKIFQYELRKIYHKNTNIKHLFFIFKIYIFIDKNFNDEISNFHYFEILNKEDPIFRLRNFIKNELQENSEIENVKIVKDEYNSYFLQKSYPIIHEIEGSLRELIYKTMTFMAKKDWEKKEVPENIQNQIKEDRKELGIYGTDFSHLSKLLFDRTENSNINLILSKLENLSECKKDDLIQLKSKIPTSNWQKYFSKIQIEENIIEIRREIYDDKTLTDSDIIKKLLTDLNNMRNKVAHNNFYVEDDFYDILTKKSTYIKTWIRNAINYIESEAIKNSNQKILTNLTPNEKRLYDEIIDLIEETATFYNQKSEQIYSFLNKNFCDSIEQEDGTVIRKSKYKCINTILYFIRMKNYISNETKLVSNDDLTKYTDEIEELKKQIKQDCPSQNIQNNNLSKRRNFSEESF